MNPKFKFVCFSDGYIGICPICDEMTTVLFKDKISPDPAIAVKPIFDHVVRSHPLADPELEMFIDDWKEAYANPDNFKPAEFFGLAGAPETNRLKKESWKKDVS